MSKPDFSQWDEVFDKSDHEWMTFNAADHLAVIERMIRDGATVEQVSNHAAKRVGSERAQFVKRCEGAARYLRANKAE